MGRADRDNAGGAITIYGIADPATSLVHYVGKTAGSPLRRLREHSLNVERGSQYQFHCWLREHLKAGRTVEVFVIETVDHHLWAEAEEFWIGYLRAIGCPLKNVSPGGDGINGYRISREHAKRIGNALRGKPKSADHIAAWKAAQSFAPPSPEARSKISASLKGRAKSADHIEKVAAKRRGQRHSAETRKHISEILMSPEVNAKLVAARAGRPPMSAETKAKISAAKRGSRASPETRAKMSVAQSLRHRS